MKVQAINSSTNFKGLFTDKSKEHNGNWHMEYAPYAWESNNTGKMAIKERVDIFAPTLPDNEEIFTANNQHYKYKEVSSDILGTDSYYQTNDGKMRRTITQVPAMNREESLKVLDRKLDMFILKKENEMTKIEKSITPLKQNTDRHSASFDTAANKFSSGYNHSQELFCKSEGISKMWDAESDERTYKRFLKEDFDSLHDSTTKYITLNKTLNTVKATKAQNQSEIKKLGQLRANGQLIDISKRDIQEPNKALVEALKDMKKAVAKYLCLPHKLISMEGLLKQINTKNWANVPTEEVIKYADSLIKKVI